MATFVNVNPECENGSISVAISPLYDPNKPHVPSNTTFEKKKTILNITKLLLFSPVCMEQKCVIDIQVHCLQLVPDWENLDHPRCYHLVFEITIQDKNSYKI